MHSKTRVRGFTLVELLVVIAIIGILVALLLPAVQAAREAASRSQCQNNLKQLVLGIHNAHDTNKVLPPGYIYYGSPYKGVADYSESGWVYRVLPFIEQTNLYNTIDYKVVSAGGNSFGQGTPATQTVRTTPLAMFKCPSDPGDPALQWGIVRGNYVASGGVGYQTFNTSTSKDHTVGQGVFQNISQLTLQGIKDGTSNTVFLSEVIVPLGADHRGVMYYPTGSVFQHTNTPNSGVDQLRNGAFVNDDPAAPAIGSFNSYNDVNQVMTARSRHSGGVNAAMGDGSVRFITNSVALVVWQGLGTSRGGEVPGEF